MDAHDKWNLVALGALNVAHVGWWCGLLTGPAALHALFLADVAYIALDTCWLIFVPSCVAPRVRGTLIVHHILICTMFPLARNRPLLQRHLLRTWVVELQSWAHIAARHGDESGVGGVARRLNKPAFIALRLIAFPLSWFGYVSDRAALPAAIVAAHAPPRTHLLLGGVHSLFYALMIKWGWTLLR